MTTSLKQIQRIAAGMALAVAFSGAAMAQERCAPQNVLEYDLRNDGLSFQSGGDITSSEFSGHRMELYANGDTGRWTLMEIKDGEDACFYKVGGIYFHENESPEDGERTLRQSALARHGHGDGGNEAHEIFVHEATGRWFMTRRTSANETEILFAGDDFHEENNPPRQPVTRIRDMRPGL